MELSDGSVVKQSIVIEGLDKVDELSLRSDLKGTPVKTDSRASGTQAGELATIVVIAIGVPAIKGFVDWLNKDRTTEEEEKTIEFVDSEGKVSHRETIRTLKKISTSKEGLIKHIAKTFGIEIPDGL